MTNARDSYLKTGEKEENESPGGDQRGGASSKSRTLIRVVRSKSKQDREQSFGGARAISIYNDAKDRRTGHL